MGVFEALQGGAETAQLGKSVVIRRKIEGDPGLALHGRFQILVHIVPILMIVFQKILKILFVVDHHAVHTVGGEEDLQRFQPGVICVNMQFQPFHTILTSNSAERKYKPCARRAALP